MRNLTIYTSVAFGIFSLIFALCSRKTIKVESNFPNSSPEIMAEHESQIEMKYNLRKDHEQAFSLLSGRWHSQSENDNFECDIDFRQVKFRAKGKWKELDGATVLMGMPQADFYYSGNSYKFTFSVDENIKFIKSISIIRESPIGSGELDDIFLENLTESGQ